MADRLLFFMRLIPQEDIRPKATGSSKKLHRKPPGSPLLSIERKVRGRIDLLLLLCWLQEWVSGAEAEAAARGVHAFGLVQRWRRELYPQSRPLDFPGKTQARASGASVRSLRCTSPRRPAAARALLGEEAKRYQRASQARRR